MSKSPTGKSDLAERAETYLSNWSALGELVSRGVSFSGRERNRAFLNLDGARFADVSAAFDLDAIGDGRGIAVTDWDHDGDLDLWYSNRTGPRVHFMKNNGSNANHYISIKLSGQTCNRDAIGARLTLISEKSDGSIRYQYKSLGAGGGFLSQSSKRVHFGLAKDTSIRKLIVRWPGRQGVDEFDDLQRNRHYLVTQGAAATTSDDERDVEFAADQRSITLPNQSARTVLTDRLPLPTLTSFVPNETQSEIPINLNGPTLVTLWASWCSNCVRDLAQLSASQALFAERNLHVVAISADAIEGDPEKAQSIVDESSFPFDWGYANESLAQQLMQLTHNVFYRKLDLPIPISFLVDPTGRVAVIYKGSIDVEQIAADVESLMTSSKNLTSSAFPFPGTYVKGKFEPTPIDLARTYLEGGYFQDARQQIAKYLASVDEIDDLGQLAEHFSQSLEVDHERATSTDRSVLERLLEKQRIAAKIQGWKVLVHVEQEANSPRNELSALQHILKLNPKDLEARLSASIAFSKLGQKKKAVDLLRSTAATLPTSVKANVALAQTFMKLNLPQPAIRILEEFYSKAPEDLNLRFNLAMVNQLLGKEKRAIELYESILVEAEDANDVANNLAWLYAHSNDSKLWNLGRAKKLATELCQRTNHRNAAYLDTLSGILHKKGERSRAIQLAVEAEKLARQSGQTDLASKVRERVAAWK